MSRLINEVPVLQRLLAAVAAVPTGQKLRIPALRDALVNQADVIDGLRMLIAAGELDPATLRPTSTGGPESTGQEPGTTDTAERLRMSPTPEERVDTSEQAIGPAGCDGPVETAAPRPSGSELAARLEAAGAARGLTAVDVSKGAMGNTTGIYCLRRGARPVTRKVLERAEAWLQALPPAEDSNPSDPPLAGGTLEAAEVGTAPGHAAASLLPDPAPDAPPALPRPTGAELAAEIDDLLKRDPAVSKTAIGLLFNGCKGGVEVLRKVKRPTDATITKVERVLANPPLRERAPPAPREAEAAPRDPSTASARLSAAVRRGQTKAAEALLEREAAGQKVANASPAVRDAANLIRSRREQEARQSDPVERAKLTMQRKGHSVFSASVHGGPADHYYIGNKLVSKNELLLMAGETVDPGSGPGQALKPPPPAVAVAPSATFLKPAEMAWCDQCERRVSGAIAAKCGSRFCKLKTEKAA